MEFKTTSGLLPDKVPRKVVEVAGPLWRVATIYRTSSRKNLELEPTISTTLGRQARGRVLLHQPGTILAKKGLQLAVQGHRPLMTALYA